MTPPTTNLPIVNTFKVSSLFAGVGGVELGLQRWGHETLLFCEFEEGAKAVLRNRFPDIPLHSDVRTLDRLPAETELLTAGFPCQDLSQAGKTEGIRGARSGLVGEVFRLLATQDVPHVLLENVPFMLQLDRGRAMRMITDEFERLGYRWAYRVLDSRAFGLPQRRQRVFFLASRSLDPARVLLTEDRGEPDPGSHAGKACGFYWTEGLRGLGWAVDGVPTLKGGSTIGIPSPPAIWFPDGRIATPDIRDAERLQGFEIDWTRPAESVARPSHRWKLVGNAVSVGTAGWVGRRLAEACPDGGNIPGIPVPFDEWRSWPLAAFGAPGAGRFEVPLSRWPVREDTPPLSDFLKFEVKPLSHRAVSGFLDRLGRGNLRYPDEFLHDLLKHRDQAAEDLRMAS